MIFLLFTLLAQASETDSFSRWGINPSALLKYSKEKTAVNLLSYDYGKSLVNGSAADSVRLANFSSGVIASESRKLELGLGAELGKTILNFPLSNVGVFFGLVPVVGRTLFVEQWKASPKDPFHARSLDPANLFREFADWFPGDRAEYSAKGGLLFQAGVGNILVGAEGSLLLEGEWRVSLRKESDQSLQVRIAKEKLNSAKVQLKGVFVKASLEQTKRAGDAFEYELDMAEPLAPKIFADLVQGNLAGVAAKFAQSTALKKLNHRDWQSFALEKAWSIKVPLLVGKSGIERKISQKENHVPFADGSSGRLDSEVMVTLGEGKKLARHNLLQKLFVAALAVQTDQAQQEMDSSWQSEFTWSFQSDRIDSEDLRDAFRRLEKSTGLGIFHVNVPKHIRWGFSRITARMRIPQSTWERALERTGAKTQRSKFSQLLSRMAQVQEKPELLLKKIPQLGKVLWSNAQEFQTAMQVLGEGIELRFSVEGERIARYETEFRSRADGSFEVLSAPISSVWRQKQSKVATLPGKR